MFVFFPAEKNQHEFLNAEHTGMRMQRTMKKIFQPIQHESLKSWFGEDHPLELSMSIGICSGRLFEALVGTTAQRDHIIMGKLPGAAMAAEEAGDRDDVIISAELQAAFANHFDTAPA